MRSVVLLFFVILNNPFSKKCFNEYHNFQARKIEVPTICNQIFLPAIAVDRYLTKLQKNNFNVFDKSLQLGSPMLPLGLYYRRLLNKY